MAEHPNIDLIRRYSEALAAGQLASVYPFYADDLVLHIPGRGPHSGTFHGQDAVLAYYTRLFRDIDGHLEILGLDDHLASDDRAVTLVRWRLTRGDRSIEVDRAAVYRIVEGRIAEIWVRDLDQYAYDEFFADVAAPPYDGAAYQASLLAALGDDDPAEVQAATPAAIRALVADAGPDLRTRPAAGEWSALGCLDHIHDAEIVMAGRYRWALAHDEPELGGYDQDLWVDALHPDDEDVEALLAVFEPLRRADIELWQATSEQGRRRVAHHRERGPESVDLMFRMIAGHDRVHLAQARAALAAVRAR